jgi:hypothetical protein
MCLAAFSAPSFSFLSAINSSSRRRRRRLPVRLLGGAGNSRGGTLNHAADSDDA